MKIEAHNRGDVCILQIEGELGYGESAAVLRRRFDALVAEGRRLFLFDMLGLQWMDSSGIGEVVACHQKARRVGGSVKLVLQGKSRSQFAVNQLEKMFDIFGGVEAGVASFDHPRSGPPASF